MRRVGSPGELEHKRVLAIHRVMEGYSTSEIAEFLEVDASSVWRWIRMYRRFGMKGLRANPVPGRPPKLTRTQEKVIRRWLLTPPTTLGFPTDLWSAPRLGYMVEEEFGIHLNANYLSSWLRCRNYTPQKPERRYWEANYDLIGRWVKKDWVRIKKKPEISGLF